MHNEKPDEPSPHGDAAALREMREAEAELRKAEAEHREATELEARAKADEAEAIKRIEAAEADLEREKPIEIKVDGEDFVTERREMTPNEIMREFGGKSDLSKFYLIELVPADLSFQGKGDEKIHLHSCMEFAILSLGPATVSDPNAPKTGIAAFIAGLVAMGHDPKQLAGNASAVHFAYDVPAGPHAGRKVRLGLIVPPDFPMTPPSGPFVSPRVLPISGGGGSHPTGGIHAWHQFNPAGGEWEYWSRPCGDWQLGRKTVGAYMAHIYKLWATL